MTRPARWALLPALLLLAAPAWAEYELQTRNLRLAFADNGDLLFAEACLPACDAPGAHRRTLGGAGPVVSFTSFATEAFTLAPGAGQDGLELLFEGESAGSLRRWRIPNEGFVLGVDVQGAERVDLSGGPGLRGIEAAGFGKWLEQPRYLRIADGDVDVLGLDEALEPIEARGWTGFRNRFWAVMVHTARPLRTHLASGAGVRDAAVGLDTPHGATLDLYLGPVEPAALRAADPELDGLMYASLWFWLRWICQALFWLLTMIYALVPHWATAIVLLSVAVSILMRPLSRIADRLQDQVHHTEAKLGPELAAIRKQHKGEEQSKRILALYKQHGVHPLYSLKSLAGVAVVIPVFIGAFDMLAENIWLAGEPFAWITDLARPDAIAALPFSIPFFGDQLNLLPFIMTALSVWASVLHRHEAMTAAQFRAHQRNLTLMALAFLALFYTFPAGMVLYWTANNAVSVLKYGFRKLRQGQQ